MCRYGEGQQTYNRIDCQGASDRYTGGGVQTCAKCSGSSPEDRLRGVLPGSLPPPQSPIGYRPMEPQIPRENHPHPYVSVIIPAMNEAGKIAAVIAEARAVHPESEVIVVANGCRDQTAAVAERMGAKVLSFSEPLGNDVGRSVGAQAAKGRILLLQTATW